MKISENKMSPDYLRERLHYDPETGVLTWRPKQGLTGYEARFNCRFAGKAAGGVSQMREEHRYLKVCIDGKHLWAHRVAWAIYYGEWPADQIDHINGDGLDNRIVNLRVVSNQENSRNARLYRCNVSGKAGVTWFKSMGKWRADITVKGRQIFLGAFDDLADAIAAREAAEHLYQGLFHQNHGKPIDTRRVHES